METGEKHVLICASSSVTGSLVLVATRHGRFCSILKNIGLWRLFIYSDVLLPVRFSAVMFSKQMSWERKLLLLHCLLC